jgi:Flp pilus assembly protein TadG
MRRVSWRRNARGGARSDAGQATVEFALVLPVVVLMLMAAFQVALLARDQVLTVQAARASVREAAVASGDARVQGAAKDVLADAHADIVSSGDIGAPIVVRVRYRSRTTLPLVGPLFPDPELTAKAVMRREK